MDIKEKNIKKTVPDYKQIYSDLVALKYPEKLDKCTPILQKRELDFLDVLEINNILKPNKTDQNLKSYDKSTILKILDYQKKNNLNNTELAIKFKMSRNTVGKWKKIFF